MKAKSFNLLAARSAIFAGFFGLLYSFSFVFLQNNLLSALFLLLGGLSVTVVMTALYQHLRETQAAYALLAFVFSVGAAAGSLIHGGYDLSNALHPPAALNLDLPNPIDPRGLLTFGVGGIGLLLVSRLMANNKMFPKRISTLGYVSAILMIALYLGRLIILRPTSLAIVIPALLEGFIVNPLWYAWLGIVWLRKK